MAAPCERGAALRVDAGHQSQQRQMASACHALDWLAVMVAELGQCRFKQNEVTQLLMKYGVASRHKINPPSNT
ncbi:MAG: hypothetical protein WCE49_04065 [Terrimicrobiaceae bacterium]